MGKSNLKNRFQQILADFFPRYTNVLIRYKENISEVRIEGHTSSEWNDFISKKEAYFENLVLSHDRSREVVVFCLVQKMPVDQYKWIRHLIVASGMSSSRLIYRDGVEDKLESRRVDFRVRTNAEEKLSEILNISS